MLCGILFVLMPQTGEIRGIKNVIFYLAGLVRFELTNNRVKVCCLTSWR
nr:hypothetical protein YSBCXYJI_YSBCXYJI_CDS_0059 [Caudoviricetes sp.]